MSARIVVVSQIFEGTFYEGRMHKDGDWSKPEPQSKTFSFEDNGLAEIAMFVLWQKRMAELQMGRHELPWLERFLIASILDDGSLELDEDGRVLTIGMS